MAFVDGAFSGSNVQATRTCRRGRSAACAWQQKDAQQLEEWLVEWQGYLGVAAGGTARLYELGAWRRLFYLLKQEPVEHHSSIIF